MWRNMHRAEPIRDRGRSLPTPPPAVITFGMPAPTLLHTPRLILRPPAPGDAEGVFTRYASDPRVTRFMAWPTHTSIEDSRGFITFAEAQWATESVGSYLAFHRQDGRLLGGSGLEYGAPGVAETGYVLAVDAWGQGFATELLGAMVGLARSLGIRELTAGCHPDHQASIRVLEKHDFVMLGRLERSSGFPNLEPGLTQDRLSWSRRP